MPAHIWLDGRPAAVLPLPDRGLDYGDGLFETLLIRGGKALHLNLHMERLELGLRVLRFPACRTVIERHIATSLAAFATEGAAVMRVTITRGEGERGYAPPQKCRPRVIVSLSPRASPDLGDMLEPASLVLAKMRWSTQPALAGLKHLNRLEQVLASQEITEAKADEAIMLDQQGSVVSLCAANLFMVRKNVLYTPSLTHCGVKGTRRRLVLESLAPQLGLETREAELSLAQLSAASEVFYCNSLQGMRPVARFESCHWHNHDVCTALHRLYVEGAI